VESSDPADVAVIGAGVVGCAMSRRFALEGARVVLLEAAHDILAGASKGNSAILHTGFDAPPGSLEHECMQAGRAEYLEIRAALNLPLLETGAMLVAWTEAEEGALDAIESTARVNLVPDPSRLGPAAILAREPNLSARARAALLIPGEHIIDPWSAPLAYALQALANGAQIFRGTQVTAGAFDGALWHLTTPRGKIRARTVINCAGLHGDRVDEALLGRSDFEIRPRKGQFVVFDKTAATLLRTIILPVPSERTKGVVLAPTIFGNVLVGPTAEDQDDRARADTSTKTLRALLDRAAEILPALAAIPVTATYAGLRPATDRKEYRIVADPARHRITVGGIRSTGLTAALGIARHVYRLYESSLYESSGRAHSPPAAPATPRMPNLAEHLPRDWQTPGYGEIVCHCELVTRREIEAALAGPLPATDLGGLRRRTRAAMGRCQGFNCLARLAALAGPRLPIPPA